MSLFSWWRRKPAPACAWELSRPLLGWSKSDVWTIREAVEGTLILGATGSGKSSGSGAAIAKAMLAAGFGGLILTAKKDEVTQWHAQRPAGVRVG
jgi:hypothetical protein